VFGHFQFRTDLESRVVLDGEIITRR
jgi:hypothetical protein